MVKDKETESQSQSAGGYPIHHEDPIVHAAPRRARADAGVASVPDVLEADKVIVSAFRAFAELDHSGMYEWLRDSAPSAVILGLSKCIDHGVGFHNWDQTIDFGVFTRMDLQKLACRVVCDGVSKWLAGGLYQLSKCPILDMQVDGRGQVTLKYVLSSGTGLHDGDGNDEDDDDDPS